MDQAEKNGNAKSSVVDLLEKKDIRVRGGGMIFSFPIISM